MGKRLFDENSGWNEDAWRIFRRLKMAVTIILDDEPEIDIRDFHFVATDAVGDVVSTTAINRRLERKNEAK